MSSGWSIIHQFVSHSSCPYMHQMVALSVMSYHPNSGSQGQGQSLTDKILSFSQEKRKTRRLVCTRKWMAVFCSVFPSSIVYIARQGGPHDLYVIYMYGMGDASLILSPWTTLDESDLSARKWWEINRAWKQTHAYGRNVFLHTQPLGLRYVHSWPNHRAHISFSYSCALVCLLLIDWHLTLQHLANIMQTNNM